MRVCFEGCNDLAKSVLSLFLIIDLRCFLLWDANNVLPQEKIAPHQSSSSFSSSSAGVASLSFRCLALGGDDDIDTVALS